MKKFVTLLLALFVVLSCAVACGQTGKPTSIEYYVPVKLIQCDENGNVEGTTEIFYNENNLPEKIVKSSGGMHTVSVYTYDEKGNVIKEVYTSSKGEVSIYESVYDSAGNTIKYTSTDSDGDVTTYEYFYNANGKKSQKNHLVF